MDNNGLFNSNYMFVLIWRCVLYTNIEYFLYILY